MEQCAGTDEGNRPVAYETIAVEAGRITTVALNRPERRNAITIQMEEELLDALKSADRSGECRAIILRGNGQVFSAGHDLYEAAERAAGSPDVPPPPFGTHIMHEEVWNVGTPIISAVHGFVGPHAIHLITATDLVVAAEGTTFSFEFARVGGGHSFPLLTFTIGIRRYKEWRLLAQALDAQRAQEWGLINAVVPPQRLMDHATAWAESIAETPVESAVGNKLSINKDFERLGIWELLNLQSRFAPAGRPNERSRDYFKAVRDQGLSAARREAGATAEDG